MNALTETTIAMTTQRATILMDHLVALAILASLEMEPIVKVFLFGIRLFYKFFEFPFIEKFSSH